jgi:hypothetical protein
MDEKTKAMALQAIANVKPLPGYEIGLLDAAVNDDLIIVVLLDGRKMTFDLPNMAAPAKPATTMKVKGKKKKK